MYLKILSDLAGLDVAEGETNAGGIRRLRLMPRDEVLKIIVPNWFPDVEAPDFGPLIITGQSIVIPDGTPFLEIEVIPEYASYTEDLDRESNGNFYRPTIQIIIPKDRPGVAAWCHRCRSVRWIALIQDRNGYNRLVGTDRQPLTMSISNSLGGGKGRNARVLTFSALTEQPAFFVDAIDDAVLFPDGPFNFSFSFAFES